MKKRFELDFLGQFYASTLNEKHSGIFSITVYLKENLNRKILKQAMVEILKRFPFLSGGLRHNFFWYEYEITNNPLPLIPIKGVPPLKNNEQIFRVLYDSRHLILEVNHLLCDGRTLSRIAKELLMCYFEFLGVRFDDNNESISSKISCEEELENSYLRFIKFTDENVKTYKKKSQLKISAYRPPISEHAPIQMLTYQLSANKIKETAKLNQTTISGLLLSLIFKSVSIERGTLEHKEPIVISVPVDCRSFFPSKTMRNFVTAQNIIMPEVENSSVMIKEIQGALEKIDKNSVYTKFREHQKMYQAMRYVPRKIKDLLVKKIAKNEFSEHTTGFSNIGKIDFPKNIAEKIDSMTFFAETDGISPYFFSCITTGDVLTLSVALKTENKILIGALENNLMPFLQTSGNK